jgi:nucleoside-diphosphate-sugar epimerase
MTQKKIIILGGQGFVGLNISKYILTKKKKYKLILIGNETKLKRIFTKREKKKLTIYNIDIHEIRKLPSEIFKGAVVINAFLTKKTPHKIFSKKYIKLCNFLKKKNINRFILLSSISVYGKTIKAIVSEKIPLNPFSNYGKVCFSAEKISKKLFKNKLIILRIANIFGKYRSKNGIIEKILTNLLIKFKYHLTDSNLKRTYINVSTLVKIISILIDKDLKKDIVYNISNPNYVFNFSKLNVKISKILKKKVIYYLKSKKIINNHDSVCFPKTFMKEFNFSFKNIFENELLQVAKFIVSNLKKQTS